MCSLFLREAGDAQSRWKTILVVSDYECGSLSIAQTPPRRCLFGWSRVALPPFRPSCSLEIQHQRTTPAFCAGANLIESTGFLRALRATCLTDSATYSTCDSVIPG